MKTLRIGFLLPRTSLHARSYMCLVMRALAEAGAEVDIVYPVNHPVDLSHVRVEHDLYVWRKMSGLAFSLAGALHRLGAALVNPYPASAAVGRSASICTVSTSSKARGRRTSWTCAASPGSRVSRTRRGSWRSTSSERRSAPSGES